MMMMIQVRSARPSRPNAAAPAGDTRLWRRSAMTVLCVEPATATDLR